MRSRRALRRSSGPVLPGSGNGYVEVVHLPLEGDVADRPANQPGRHSGHRLAEPVHPGRIHRPAPERFEIPDAHPDPLPVPTRGTRGEIPQVTS